MNRKAYLEKYINGTATPQEKKLVTAWITGLLERVANGVASSEEQEIVSYWLEQNHDTILNTEEIEKRKKETLLLIQQQQRSFSRRKKQNKIYRYAAAVLILLSGIGAYLIIQNRQHTPQLTYMQYVPADSIDNNRIIYHAAQGMPLKKIQLPDSSFIFLNTGAILSLDSTKFNKDIRTVTLEKGEAFFKIAKNPAKKFIVTFDDFTTEVLGTSFNIETYAQTNDKRVFVKTGRVLIKQAEKILTTLTAGETFIINNQTKKYSISKNYKTDRSQWINGGLVFSSSGLDEIKQKLEARSGLKVITENDALSGTLQLNAIFSKEDSSEKIAKVIADIYGVKVRINQQQIVFYK
ncbi:MAG: FecR domain-containing protein [Niabella sp.]